MQTDDESDSVPAGYATGSGVLTVDGWVNNGVEAIVTVFPRQGSAAEVFMSGQWWERPSGRFREGDGQDEF